MTPERAATDLAAKLNLRGDDVDGLEAIHDALVAVRDAAYTRGLADAEGPIEEQRIVWINAGHPEWALCATICKERVRALAGTGAPDIPLIEDHAFTPHTHWKKDVCDARFVEGERSRVCARTRKEHAR